MKRSPALAFLAKALLASTFVVVTLAAAQAQSPVHAQPPAQAQNGPQSYRIAQAAKPSSCKAMFDLCASRCKTRLPDDRNCTSDHCSPKLPECRSTGCWQEGRLYGGALTCNLAK